MFYIDSNSLSISSAKLSTVGSTLINTSWITVEPYLSRYRNSYWFVVHDNRVHSPVNKIPDSLKKELQTSYKLINSILTCNIYPNCLKRMTGSILSVKPCKLGRTISIILNILNDIKIESESRDLVPA